MERTAGVRAAPAGGSRALRAAAEGGVRAGAARHLAPQVESARGLHLDWLSEKPTFKRHHTLHVFSESSGSAGEPGGKGKLRAAKRGGRRGVSVRRRGLLPGVVAAAPHPKKPAAAAALRELPVQAVSQQLCISHVVLPVTDSRDCPMRSHPRPGSVELCFPLGQSLRRGAGYQPELYLDM